MLTLVFVVQLVFIVVFVADIIVTARLMKQAKPKQFTAFTIKPKADVVVRECVNRCCDSDDFDLTKIAYGCNDPNDITVDAVVHCNKCGTEWAVKTEWSRKETIGAANA